jgi:tetratricopeptide (TPR) repeat protein
MLKDIHGLPVSTTSGQAAAEFARALLGYLKYRADAPAHLASCIAADPDFGLAHCMRGYFLMLSFKNDNVPVAAEAAATARSLTAGATPREQLHVSALDAWVAGKLDTMLAIWESILSEHPTDALAFRLAHFNNFWLGRPQDMRASADRVFSAWDPELAAYGSVLACRSFAYEECGAYTAAERFGRAAVEIDSADLWAAHAVAHVMEMQGRRSEGIAWLQGLERQWAGANNLSHHLWWHCAMFHLERREFDAALELYDSRFRNLESALTQAQPDLYIDVQNAASMLFRLERQGLEVGERWIELADKAEQRIGDCLSAFTLPHWMMALAAAGRRDAAQRLIEAMRNFGNQTSTLAPIVSQVAVPVSQAVLAHREGNYAQAVDLMEPVLDAMSLLGGSHAQQDVLEQLYFDSAVKAGQGGRVRQSLARARSRRPVPPEGRVGYAMKAAG